jgi:putative transposase
MKGASPVKAIRRFTNNCSNAIIGVWMEEQTTAPTAIVTKLKSITANRVFAVFPNLKKKYFWGSGLWSRGYYIGTAGNVSAATIRKYIEAQKSPRKEVKNS